MIVVAACGDNDNATGDTSVAPNAPIQGTSWVLDSAGIDKKMVDAVAVAALDFDADGSTLTGSTGCNQFRGTYSQRGSDLTITLGPVTLAACTSPALTAQETAIMRQLPLVTSFNSAGQLELLDSSGATLLVYAAGIAGLKDTSWTVAGVNNGKGGVESSTLAQTLTAKFSADGSLSGFSGCNQYNGSYQTSGTDGVTITNIATTRRACDETAMTLETQYTTALGTVATYEISGATLTLRDAGGSAQVTLTAAN